jgi:hypothetical protein
MAADERVMRAVFMRFVPACTAALATVVGGIRLVAPDQVTLSMLATAAVELAGMTAGCAVVLTLANGRAARVRGLGPRSFAAGLVAPLFVGAASMMLPDASLAAIGLLSGLAGGASVLPTFPALLRFRVPVVAAAPAVDPQGY